MGIEPTWSAWKAETLPLSYTRILKAETCKQVSAIAFGAEDEIRTRDIRLGKATLYH